MDFFVSGLSELFEPLRLLLLGAGTLAGLIIGAIPGLGGLFALTMLVPLTFTLDPYSAFALLLGMHAVLATSDTIPAVLLGVPGTVGAMATVVDGHPLAKKGQAARALGAAYTSSLVGGVFGALVLALSIPIIRPFVLSLNFADLLAITVLGMTMVAVISSRTPVKGLIAALVGILLSYIGLDGQVAEERWTFGLLYLWDGLPLAVTFLGLFALPELATLIMRGSSQPILPQSEPGGLRAGIRDALREWRTLASSSSLGALLGAMPGIGVTIIEWIAYGRVANRPRKGEVPYGEGNIRGVIAPESANNAKEGGSLIPTVAFGVPGSAAMAILLGAFTIQGLTPGPGMLTDEAPLLVTMILSIALANVLGAALCMGFTRQLARVATVPARSLVPIIAVFVVLGAFQTTMGWLDLLFLLLFGLVGIVMKEFNWPRAPLALGLVLGASLEKFTFMTSQLYDWSWLTRPLVIGSFLLAAFLLVRSALSARKHFKLAAAGKWLVSDLIVALFVLAVAVYVLVTSFDLPAAAALFPTITSSILVAVALGYSVWRIAALVVGRRNGGSELAERPPRELLFLAYVGVICLSLLAFGHLITAAATVIASGLLFRQGRPIRSIVIAALAALAVYVLFSLVAGRSWPDPWVFSG